MRRRKRPATQRDSEPLEKYSGTGYEGCTTRRVMDTNTRVQSEQDLEGYIAERAAQERARGEELTEEYGDNLPLKVFNQIFILACCHSLLNLRKENIETFNALAAKMKDPNVMLSDEQITQIQKGGSHLVVTETGCVVHALDRAIYREAEERVEGGFTAFMDIFESQNAKG